MRPGLKVQFNCRGSGACFQPLGSFATETQGVALGWNRAGASPLNNRILAVLEQEAGCLSLDPIPASRALLLQEAMIFGVGKGFYVQDNGQPPRICQHQALALTPWFRCKSLEKAGASGKNRTSDQGLMSPLLYR